MMVELLLDVMDRFLNLRDTNAQCAIALLPRRGASSHLSRHSRQLLADDFHLA